MPNVSNLWGVSSLEILEEFLGADTGPCINSQLHFTDFLVNVFHKLNDKIHEFMFKHLLCVKIGYQKTDVVSFNGLPSENNKVFSPHHHKTHELLAKDLLNLVSLLYCYAYSQGIDGAFNKNFLSFVPAYHHRC